MIDRELRVQYPNLTLVPLVVDVGDVVAMEQAFDEHEPPVVIHAAAHKHVPLMEVNPAESVRNNVLATATLTDLADGAGWRSSCRSRPTKRCAPRR